MPRGPSALALAEHNPPELTQYVSTQDAEPCCRTGGATTFRTFLGGSSTGFLFIFDLWIFASRGEESRLRWLNITHQYDMLGRLCAYLAPYNIPTTDGSW